MKMTGDGGRTRDGSRNEEVERRITVVTVRQDTGVEASSEGEDPSSGHGEGSHGTGKDHGKSDNTGKDSGKNRGSGKKNGGGDSGGSKGKGKDGGSDGGGGKGKDGGGGGDQEEDGGTRATALERINGFIGAAIVLGIIGFLLYEAIWGDESPPNVEAALVRVVPSGDDWLADIMVRNLGGNTAAGVTVTGKLKRPGASESQAETASVTIDYVPPGSNVKAGLYFDERPTEQTLQLDVGGYARP